MHTYVTNVTYVTYATCATYVTFQENLIEALQLGAERADGGDSAEHDEVRARSPGHASPGHARTVTFAASASADGRSARSEGAAASSGAAAVAPMAEDHRLSASFVWQPHGSHNSLVADAQEFTEGMGSRA